jgi:hypothetical protein
MNTAIAVLALAAGTFTYFVVGTLLVLLIDILLKPLDDDLPDIVALAAIIAWPVAVPILAAIILLVYVIGLLVVTVSFTALTIIYGPRELLAWWRNEPEPAYYTNPF